VKKLYSSTQMRVLQIPLLLKELKKVKGVMVAVFFGLQLMK